MSSLFYIYISINIHVHICNLYIYIYVYIYIYILYIYVCTVHDTEKDQLAEDEISDLIESRDLGGQYHTIVGRGKWVVVRVSQVSSLQ